MLQQYKRMLLQVIGSSLVVYIYLITISFLISYIICSFACFIDYHLILSVFFITLVMLAYSTLNLNVILVDYVNSESSQILLISLLQILVSSIIIYLLLLL